MEMPLLLPFAPRRAAPRRLQERMHVVWQELVVSGLVEPTDFVRLTSTAAAVLFNIYPRKGVVAVGSDADMIVFDPEAVHTLGAATHHSARDTNIYEGYRVKGKVGGGGRCRRGGGAGLREVLHDAAYRSASRWASERGEGQA